MSKGRKATPDILGAVMGNGNENQKTIKQESNKSVKLDNGKSVKQESNTPGDLKEKATFNLSVSILEKLEDATILLKRAKRGTRVTKTLLVEKALEIAIQELEESKEDSDLYRNI